MGQACGPCAPHQAWVRLSDRPLLPQLATEAAKELTERYGGDANSADWRHNGRLAGYTNRKEEHQRPDGHYPYVLLRDASGTTAPQAAKLLERAQERFEARMQGESGAGPTGRGGPPGRAGGVFLPCGAH